MSERNGGDGEERAFAFQYPTGVRDQRKRQSTWNSTLMHFPKRLVGIPGENQGGSLTMTSANVIVEPALVFNCSRKLRANLRVER